MAPLRPVARCPGLPRHGPQSLQRGGAPVTDQDPDRPPGHRLRSTRSRSLGGRLQTSERASRCQPERCAIFAGRARSNLRNAGLVTKPFRRDRRVHESPCNGDAEKDGVVSRVPPRQGPAGAPGAVAEGARNSPRYARSVATPPAVAAAWARMSCCGRVEPFSSLTLRRYRKPVPSHDPIPAHIHSPRKGIRPSPSIASQVPVPEFRGAYCSVKPCHATSSWK
jgi:hypothetical protein